MNIKALKLTVVASLIKFVLNTFSTSLCNFPFLTGSFTAILILNPNCNLS